MATLEERVFRLECALEEAAKGFSLYFADKEAFARWERQKEAP